MQAYKKELERRQANYVPLTPVDLVARAGEVYGDRLAIVYGDVRRTWRQTYMRARQLASALEQVGVGYGDTVTVMLPNIPPAIEAHFGVPMLGAVLYRENP